MTSGPVNRPVHAAREAPPRMGGEITTAPPRLHPWSRRVKVVVVDDGELSRRGLRHTIERHGIEVAGVSDGGSRAVELARRVRPNVAVVHLTSMSEERSARLVPELAELVEVLVIGTSTETPSVVAPIEGGACGYITRDASGPELAASILSASQGRVLVLPREAGVELVHRAAEARGVGAAPTTPRFDLSDREVQVLRLLVRGKENVAIAEELFVSTSTAKKHVTAILRKLRVENRVQAAVRAARWGVLDG